MQQNLLKSFKIFLSNILVSLKFQIEDEYKMEDETHLTLLKLNLFLKNILYCRNHDGFNAINVLPSQFPTVIFLV